MLKRLSGSSPRKKTAGNHNLDFAAMLEDLPTNIMVCDLEEFKVIYVNRTTVETLRTLEHLLPVNADDIIGTCIDVFHKNPSHQRAMLADPKNLPHSAIIEVGGEYLDLLVTALVDDNGNYVAPILSWSIVTEKIRADNDAQRLSAMVENMPTNVMLLEPENFTITYANQTSINTLRTLENLLPCKADDLVGQCVDIFHKNPAHQRGILADPSNLPHKAEIALGEEKLALLVSAVRNKAGEYIAAMLTWDVITDRVAFAEGVRSVVGTVASTSANMTSMSESMAANAEETSSQAGTVSTAAEEMTASISEIAEQVTRATSTTESAVAEADDANEKVKGLSVAAEKIGEVVDLITDIAEQTNLLALNATIEAARAGDAGRGFAVVASEVKNLANQTAKATEEIAEQVGGIRGATESAVSAIEGITEKISEINEISSSVAAAVEQQNAATAEVARNITGVSEASNETGQTSAKVLEASQELSQLGEQLSGQIDAFLNQGD